MSDGELQVNAVGDVELVTADAMLALAQPTRLSLIDRLTSRGPATTEELARIVRIPVEEAIGHLTALAEAGLIVHDEEAGRRGWRAHGTGIHFEIPDDDGAAQAAARKLSNTMLLKYADLPREWVEDVEPQLELPWVRAAGLFNAKLMLTPDELRQVQADLEQLLGPYLNRAESPADARGVRMLAYFLPGRDPAR